MTGLVIGAAVVAGSVYVVAVGRRRGSARMQRFGLIVLAIAVLYLLVGVLAEFGPDLTQD